MPQLHLEEAILLSYQSGSFWMVEYVVRPVDLLFMCPLPCFLCPRLDRQDAMQECMLEGQALCEPWEERCRLSNDADRKGKLLPRIHVNPSEDELSFPK